MGAFQKWLDKQPDPNNDDCCPDPEAHEMDYGVDDIIASHGFDPRTTPIDTLMNAQSAMHRDVADFMEHSGGAR